MKSNKQSGLAIWYILAGIALFAALSYSFMRSVSQNSSGSNQEKALIISNEVLQYSQSLKQAIQRLLIVNGCSENDISFYSPKWPTPASYDNANSPFAGGDFNCHVFQREGAGVAWKGTTELGVGANLLITSDCNLPGLASSNTDIVMIIRNVPLSVCKAVNSTVGVDMPSDVPPAQPFSCNYNSLSDGTFQIAGTLAGATRKETACLEGSGGLQPAGQYFIYSGLHIR